jgi:hypothetical protein
MSDSNERAHPPPAKTSDRGVEAFRSLLASAARDPSAAKGLALAYREFAVEQRTRIVEAVADDARRPGNDSPVVLAALLSVEEDGEVARRIAGLISAAGGEGLAPTGRERFFVVDDDDGGKALLIRPLFGAFVEMFALEWRRDAGITRVAFEPLMSADELGAHLDRSRVGAGFEEVSLEYAVSRVTPVLWEHRKRTGSLPPALARLQDLFRVADAPVGIGDSVPRG